MKCREVLGESRERVNPTKNQLLRGRAFFLSDLENSFDFFFFFSTVATLVFERGGFGPEIFSYRRTSPLRTFHTRRLQCLFLGVTFASLCWYFRVVCRVDGILRRERRGS